MKKLLNILVLLLAVNFLALAGGVGWLAQSGRLDRARVEQIRQILFPPPPPAQTAELATQSGPATQPSTPLEMLLARYSGRTAGEQIEFIQRTFDTRMAQLDRRERELGDLQRQVELAKDQLTRDRAALDGERGQLAAREAEVTRLQGDEGFQSSLALYTSMPAKQVKSIFMALDDATLIDYLRAMQPRTAAKILREFKTVEEISRIERVLEKMRQAEVSTGE